MHFWYSEKQRNVMRKRRDRQRLAKINGALVEYTECSKKKRVVGLWDDYKYLGKGMIYSINGVVQGVR